MDSSISLYSIRDDLTGFTDPVSFSSDFVAKNSFSVLLEALLKENRSISSYSVYKVGDFDVVSGIISPCVPPVFLCSSADFNFQLLRGGDNVEVSQTCEA